MSAFLVLDSISLVTPDGRPLFNGLTLALGASEQAWSAATAAANPRCCA
jgi:hypothetical protein